MLPERGQRQMSSRRVMYFYLCQLVVPIIYLYYATPLQRALGLALILVFGAFYALSFTNSTRRRLLSTACMMVIMWGLSWWLSPGYLALIFYPTAVMAFLKGRLMWIGYLVLAAGTAIEAIVFFHRGHAQVGDVFPSIAGILFSVVAMVFMIRYYGKLHEVNQQLEIANNEIERLTKVAERERFSRDLHDVMGHQLSMISLKSQVAAKVLAKQGDTARAIQEMVAIESAAREALARVRDYIHDMRTADFQEEWHAAKALLEAAGIQPHMVTDASFAMDHASVETNATLAMCLREAVTNVVRHSQAQTAVIRIWSIKPEVIGLVVADDGRGIPGLRETSANDMSSNWSGHGLAGIRARLDSLHGRLRVWSRHMSCPLDDDWGSIPTMPHPSTVICLELPSQLRRDALGGVQS